MEIKWHRHTEHWLSECDRYQLQQIRDDMWIAFRYNEDGSHSNLGRRVTPELAAELCYLDAGGQ